MTCLRALARQTCRPQTVLILANNCSDETAEIAARAASEFPYRLRVTRHCFPERDAHAGSARRLAMGLSEQLARRDGVLLTTDADAVPARDWVERNCKAIADGADLVCGRVALDPLEAELIPAHFHSDDALERRFVELLDRIADRLDPDPADPLPRHSEAAGASLAVTAAAFRRVGGIPAVPSGEDRAFVRALASVDARIRHDPSILVLVSGRTRGRASGGMADTIRRRIQMQDEFADDRVEPAVDAYRRYDFRRRVRQAWQERSLPIELVIDLGISPRVLAETLAERHFGRAWSRIEEASPFLTRRPVRFTELPRQIAHALDLLQLHNDSDLVCEPGGPP